MDQICLQLYWEVKTIYWLWICLTPLSILFLLSCSFLKKCLNLFGNYNLLQICNFDHNKVTSLTNSNTLCIRPFPYILRCLSCTTVLLVNETSTHTCPPPPLLLDSIVPRYHGSVSPGVVYLLIATAVCFFSHPYQVVWAMAVKRAYVSQQR